MLLNEITDNLISIRQKADTIRPDCLEAIPFSNPDQATWVEIIQPEFTSLCPMTGLPDFGEIKIRYLPDGHIVELKSLKYYFLQYRNAGIFYEELTKLILEHLKACLNPLELTVTARMTPRGGLQSIITSSYKR
jgi:7-cyano-7-deazaguanine reductase